MFCNHRTTVATALYRQAHWVWSWADVQVHVAVAGTETDHLAKLINEKAEEVDAACIVMASHGKTSFQVMSYPSSPIIATFDPSLTPLSPLDLSITLLNYLTVLTTPLDPLSDLHSESTCHHSPAGAQIAAVIMLPFCFVYCSWLAGLPL